MKKKFVAMLLVLATLLTLLPVTAMAADCNHSSNKKTYTCNNNYTHKIYCKTCKRTVEESAACTASSSFWGSSDTCQYCNGPVCNHQTTSTSNGNGTHTTKCACGKVSRTENCTFYGNSTQCWTCKGSKPCAHTYKTTTPNGDGTHTTKCNSCGVETGKGNCSYNNYTGKCNTCGGSRPCDHTLTVHTSNKDNTHDSKCACGQEVIESVACTFSGNRCTVCKDKRYCDHTLNDFAPDGKGNHSKSCDCGLEKTDPVKCTYGEDDLCTTCKGKNPCNHTPKDPTYNNDGTHTSKCDCGKAQPIDECTFGEDDLCTVCKGKNPCNHTLNNPTSNNDGTHTSKCDCEKVSSKGDCTFGEDDFCTSCKGKNPCNHNPGAPISNGNGTHTGTCDCGKEKVTTDCTFNNKGLCTLCQGECTHEKTTLKSHGHWGHSNYCDSCNVVLSTNRHYYNYFTHLCKCGDVNPEFQKSCPHEEYEAIDVNNASMHKVACRRCQLVRYYEPHGFNAKGVCTCGAIKDVSCDHSNTGHVSKGTENETICKDCGKVLESEELKCDHIHEYNVFDICIHCGAVNPNDIDPNPIKPDDEPTATYPADAWKDLDKHFTTHK